MICYNMYVTTKAPRKTNIKFASMSYITTNSHYASTINVYSDTTNVC